MKARRTAVVGWSSDQVAQTARLDASLSRRETGEGPPTASRRTRRAGDALTTALPWSLSMVAIALSLLLAGSDRAMAISDNAGTKNGNFLKIATDARGVALGDSVVTLAEGADALRWNPAGLATLQNKEFSGTHVEYYQDVQIENAAFAYPMEESGLAASVFYLSAGELDGRNAFGGATGDFSFYNLVGTIGYGRKMLTREEGLDLAVGANVKIVQEKIAEQTFNNPAFDLGLASQVIDPLRVALVARNLSSSKANFPREFILGASSAFFNKTLKPALALNYANDAPLRFSVGAEYMFPEYENAVIRAGYRTRDELDDSIDSQIPVFRDAGLAGLTMGAGFNFRPPMLQQLNLGLDYAMAPFGALGISHTITVKARW